MTCPLCSGDRCSLKAKEFWTCSNCKLVFRDPRVHLTAACERERYDLHQNKITDSGYLEFLKPIIYAVKETKPVASYGLDFGSGPSPVLSECLNREGFVVQNYDPFFGPRDLEEIAGLDFVTCVEACEHFFNPAREFTTMFNLLKPDGVLLVMTLLATAETEFSNWWYARDLTHVLFFCEETLRWLANRFGYSVKISKGRLALFSPLCPLH